MEILYAKYILELIKYKFSFELYLFGPNDGEHDCGEFSDGFDRRLLLHLQVKLHFDFRLQRDAQFL